MDILTSILIIIIVFLFPIGQVFRIDIGNGVALNSLDIGVTVLAIVTIIKAIFQKKLPKFLIPLGLVGLIGVVGLLVNKTLTTAAFTISVLYLLRFLTYALIACGVFLLPAKQKEYLWKALVVGGGIVVVAGYIQYFFYQSLSSILYEGWDPHLYRMFSTFLDPNFTGVFYVLYFLLTLHMCWEQKSRQYKIGLGVLSILGFFGVILSFSRGAYVDMGVGVLVYIFLRGYKKVAISIPLVVVVIGFLFTYFVPYGEGKNLFRTQSTHARLVSAENALTIFEKNPVWGVGFNSYRYAQHRYHLSNAYNWEDSHSGAGANNSFVFILATTGIFGGVAYGWFWIKVLKKSLQDWKKKQPYAIFFIASWVVLLVSGIFENTLFYPSLMVWLFILVGLIG